MAATSKEAAGVAAAVGGASGSAAATAAGEKDSEMKKARETVAAMPEEIAFEVSFVCFLLYLCTLPCSCMTCFCFWL